MRYGTYVREATNGLGRNARVAADKALPRLKQLLAPLHERVDHDP